MPCIAALNDLHKREQYLLQEGNFSLQTALLQRRQYALEVFDVDCEELSGLGAAAGGPALPMTLQCTPRQP